MYEIENYTKIYLFDFYQNLYVAKFENEENLIDFLGKAFYKPWYGGFGNHYFDEINCNGNDTINYFGVKNDDQTTHYTRRYMFIDDDNCIIDIRDYYQEALKRYKNGAYEYHNDDVCEELEYGDVLIQRWSKQTFRYRIDPVPNVRYGGGYRGYYRHIKTTQENRQNTDPDYKDYVRSKRKNLPTCWDEIPRCLQKSWKKQSKKRKQWM